MLPKRKLPVNLPIIKQKQVLNTNLVNNNSVFSKANSKTIRPHLQVNLPIIQQTSNQENKPVKECEAKSSNETDSKASQPRLNLTERKLKMSAVSRSAREWSEIQQLWEKVAQMEETQDGLFSIRPSCR